jgi:hypothetical protein
MLYGLPWRLYDPAPPNQFPEAWPVVWNAGSFGIYSYFQRFTPIAKIGHSISVYHLSAEDVARVAPLPSEDSR